MTSLLKMLLLSGMVTVALGKTCVDCLAGCKPKDAASEDLECPDDPNCNLCYKQLEQLEKVVEAAKEKDSPLTKREVYQKLKNIKRQTVKEEVANSDEEFETKRSLAAAAFKQAADEGTQPENLMKRAKEIARDAIQDVGDELTKRFVCGGACIAATPVLVGAAVPHAEKAVKAVAKFFSGWGR